MSQGALERALVLWQDCWRDADTKVCINNLAAAERQPSRRPTSTLGSFRGVIYDLKEFSRSAGNVEYTYPLNDKKSILIYVELIIRKTRFDTFENLAILPRLKSISDDSYSCPEASKNFGKHIWVFPMFEFLRCSSMSMMIAIHVPNVINHIRVRLLLFCFVFDHITLYDNIWSDNVQYHMKS